MSIERERSRDQGSERYSDPTIKRVISCGHCYRNEFESIRQGQKEGRTWAQKGWKRLVNRMARSRLRPMQLTSQTLRKHLWGIPNAVILGVDNSHAERMNSRIKTVKTRARGFRNKQRFRNAIYFHLGGLQLYPAGIEA